MKNNLSSVASCFITTIKPNKATTSTTDMCSYEVRVSGFRCIMSTPLAKASVLPTTCMKKSGRATVKDWKLLPFRVSLCQRL